MNSHNVHMDMVQYPHRTIDRVLALDCGLLRFVNSPSSHNLHGYSVLVIWRLFLRTAIAWELKSFDVEVKNSFILQNKYRNLW